MVLRGRLLHGRPRRRRRRRRRRARIRRRRRGRHRPWRELRRAETERGGCLMRRRGERRVGQRTRSERRPSRVVSARAETRETSCGERKRLSADGEKEKPRRVEIRRRATRSGSGRRGSRASSGAVNRTHPCSAFPSPPGTCRASSSGRARPAPPSPAGGSSSSCAASLSRRRQSGAPLPRRLRRPGRRRRLRGGGEVLLRPSLRDIAEELLEFRLRRGAPQAPQVSHHVLHRGCAFQRHRHSNQRLSEIKLRHAACAGATLCLRSKRAVAGSRPSRLAGGWAARSSARTSLARESDSGERRAVVTKFRRGVAERTLFSAFSQRLVISRETTTDAGVLSLENSQIPGNQSRLLARNPVSISDRVFGRKSHTLTGISRRNCCSL